VEGLTRTQIVQYAGASGDFNPLHTDERYAVEVGGLHSVMAHGMLTAGLTARFVEGLVPGTFVRRFGGRFVAPVWPGDTLTAQGIVSAVDEETGALSVEVTTSNDQGQVVFRGTATLVDLAAPSSETGT
jgi:acyl dehydratase